MGQSWREQRRERRIHACQGETKVQCVLSTQRAANMAGSVSTQAYEMPTLQGLPGMKTLMGTPGTHLGHTPCIGDFQHLLLIPEPDRNGIYRGKRPSPTAIQEPRQLQPRSEDRDSDWHFLKVNSSLCSPVSAADSHCSSQNT